MRRILLGITIVSLATSLTYAQDEFDDIYYNPNAKSVKKDKSSSKKGGSSSNYISDFSSMDIDDYNKRGFYYETDIDTIGQRAETTEDFVYTQQIQKYYNPTIVVDNADILADILENSYGNVNIEIQDSNPVFTSIYFDGYAWAPSYYNWNIRPSWTWNYAWGPFSWSWNYGPSWTWGGPYWSWGYGPVWGWSWGYRPWIPPHHHHPPMYAHYGQYNRPGAGRPINPSSGWSASTRPGGRNHTAYTFNKGFRPSATMGSNKTNSRVPGRPISDGLATTKKSQLSHRDNHLSGSVTANQGYGTSRHDKVEKNRVVTSTATPKNDNVVRGTQRTNTGRSERNSYTTSPSRQSNYGGYNRTSNNNRNTNTGTSGRNYNSGSSNRSYNTGGSSRSFGGGSSRSYGGGGSHGSGRGGRR